MSKNILSKNLIVKEVSLEEISNKIGENCSIVNSQGINLTFSWDEEIDETVSYFDNNNETIDIPLKIVKVTISSCINNQEESKVISMVINKCGEDLEVLIKGDSSVQSKVKAKLFGKSTSNERTKKLWSEKEIEYPKEQFDLNFLLWLIKNYKNKILLRTNNFEFKIIDIPFISDKGIYLSDIKRKGRGRELINDPIVKAVIVSIETIDALGLKISFKGGEIDFTISSNGEIEISSETNIRSPLQLNLDSDYGFEKIIIFIKKIIIMNLRSLYKNDTQAQVEINKMKSDYLIKMSQDIAELSGVEFMNRIIDNEPIKRIIVE
ncbi:MAG: hypothetical protein ACRC6A_09565 [Fusobacteriaceae bacterium]